MSNIKLPFHSINLFAKQFITNTVLAVLLAVYLEGWTQTRFYDPIFGVGVKYTIEYGKTTIPLDKVTSLTLDFYAPENDTLRKRPLIILMHGGGYLMGNKNNYPMETLCSRFAQMGYACASINYSLKFEKKGTPNDRAGKKVLQTTHELKAAIRFFRASVNNGNKFQIDANQIWVGGSSSGGITALHTAFVQAKHFDRFSWKLNDFGGLEGLGGNPNYSSKVQGVISLSGAIGDTAYIKSNIPVVSVHGVFDPIVPYEIGQIAFDFPFFGDVPPADVIGSKTIHEYLDKKGIRNDLLSLNNQGHVPFDKMLEWHHYPIYMDRTINHVRNFLYNEINQTWNTALEKKDTKTEHTNSISYERLKDKGSWYFYPVDKNIQKIKLFVYDQNGKKIKKLKVRKKRKSFYWKGMDLPEKFKLSAIYNAYRMDWEIGE